MTTTTPEPPKPQKTRRRSNLFRPPPSKAPAEERHKGLLRTASLAQEYLTYEPILDPVTGYPRVAYLFDKANPPLSITGTGGERVVNPTTLLDHLNAEVFSRVFGAPLKPSIVRLIMDGIGDQVLSLVKRDFKVRLANVVMVEKKVRKPRKARNPRTGEEVPIPTRTRVHAQPTRLAHAYITQPEDPPSPPKRKHKK